MAEDCKLPSTWLRHIRQHMHQLAMMVSNWDWHMYCQWSEMVFLMIADGRLPHGWADQYVIKNVQRDVCAIGTRIDTIEQQLKAKPVEHAAQGSNVAAS